MPAVAQLTLGLAVAWPMTIVPTVNYYKEQISAAAVALGLTESEVAKAKNDADHARADPAVEGAQRQLYKTLQLDPKITGAASGIPVGADWRPPLIPSNRFAEADGLFRLQEETTIPEERTLPMTLDVILVSPQLEDKPLSWTFRQEGLPKFTATMRDKRFLAALARSAVREQFRINIPMKVKIEVKQRRVGDEWKDLPRGRSVVEVISPKVA